jgi:hypothetical protein
LNNRLKCSQCDAVFCSEVCLRRHLKYTEHSKPGCGCATALLGFLLTGGLLAVFLVATW